MGQKKAGLVFGLVLIVALLMAIRISALLVLPPLGDEPDDFAIVKNTLFGFSNFFQNAGATDQSRLPHLLSLPFTFAMAAQNFESLTRILRFFFFSFHLLYLFLSYRLILYVSKQKTSAVIYFFLLLTSCYLSAFSIFTMTTSENLYLLFHLLSIAYFYKAFSEIQKKGYFSNLIILALLLGLCIASKLFGLFLIPAFFLFHFFSISDSRRLRVWPNPVTLIGYGLLFMIALTTINFSGVTPFLKLCSAGLLCAFYLWQVKSLIKITDPGKVPETSYGIFQVWFAIILTASIFTLIFSPIYLNFTNIIKLFSWGNRWNHGLIVSKHFWYDIPLILLMKFGLFSSLVLFTAIIFNLKFKEKPDTFRGSFGLLIFLVFVIHFLVIANVRHIVTWYPIAIFPFLYLPLVEMWQLAKKRNHKKITLAALLCVFLVIADNGYRYWKWYPYAHFDGAQYGKKFIGWNKAGFVSLEIIPAIYHHFSNLDTEKTTPVNIQAVYVQFYNEWISRLCSYYFHQHKKNHKFKFFSGADLAQPFDYLISSPIYNPKLEERLMALKEFKKLKVLSLKEIDLVTIWKKTAAAEVETSGENLR